MGSIISSDFLHFNPDVLFVHFKTHIEGHLSSRRMEFDLNRPHFFSESSPSAKCSVCQKPQILNSRRNLVTERERTERGSRLIRSSLETKADCKQIACSFQKLGKDPKLCHGNIKMGPRVIQQ